MASKTSRRWLREHFTDNYVKQAQKEGYRSRAAYKLLEIQHCYSLFKPGMMVIDLGAAPGSWSQVVAKLIKPSGRIIAVDLLSMNPIEGVEFLQGDFSNETFINQLGERLGVRQVDWVISDMAPNLSGNESIDIPSSLYLSALALGFALKTLKLGSGFFTKVFQGAGFDAFFNDIKCHFKSVIIKKPKASRDRSREIYILAKELRFNLVSMSKK